MPLHIEIKSHYCSVYLTSVGRHSDKNPGGNVSMPYLYLLPFTFSFGVDYI